jgi:hypothetical protein
LFDDGIVVGRRCQLFLQPFVHALFQKCVVFLRARPIAETIDDENQVIRLVAQNGHQTPEIELAFERNRSLCRAAQFGKQGRLYSSIMAFLTRFPVIPAKKGRYSTFTLNCSDASRA